jgi:hypothetical protein
MYFRGKTIRKPQNSKKVFFYRSLVEFVFIFFLLLIATLLNNMIPRTMSGRMDDDDDDDDEESSSIEYRPDRRLSIGTSNSNSGGINSSNRPNRNNFVSPVPTSSAHTMADLHDTAAVAAELAALSAASQPSFQRQQQQQQQQQPPHQQPPVRSTTSNAAAAAVVAKVEPFHSMNVEDLLQYFENRMNFPSKFCGASQLAIFFPHFYIIFFFFVGVLLFAGDVDFRLQTEESFKQ